MTVTNGVDPVLWHRRARLRVVVGAIHARSGRRRRSKLPGRSAPARRRRAREGPALPASCATGPTCAATSKEELAELRPRRRGARAAVPLRGLGLPVLEAMASGTPVAAPEPRSARVADGAAVYAEDDDSPPRPAGRSTSATGSPRPARTPGSPCETARRTVEAPLPAGARVKVSAIVVSHGNAAELASRCPRSSRRSTSCS